KIPWHDGPYHAQRLERYIAVTRIGLCRFRSQIPWAVLGEIFQRPGAFCYLGDCFLDCLSHLEGHDPFQLILTGPEDLCGSLKKIRSLGWSKFPPFLERLSSLLDCFFHVCPG